MTSSIAREGNRLAPLLDCLGKKIISVRPESSGLLTIDAKKGLCACPATDKQRRTVSVIVKSSKVEWCCAS